MLDVREGYVHCSERRSPTFLKRLTLGQRAFLALEVLESEILNGGFKQYLYNGTAPLFGEALAGLELIKAHQHLSLVAKVFDLFPNTEALNDSRRRKSLLGRFPRTLFQKDFDAPFYELEELKRGSLHRLQ